MVLVLHNRNHLLVLVQIPATNAQAANVQNIMGVLFSCSAFQVGVESRLSPHYLFQSFNRHHHFWTSLSLTAAAAAGHVQPDVGDAGGRLRALGVLQVQADVKLLSGCAAALAPVGQEYDHILGADTFFLQLPVGRRRRACTRPSPTPRRRQSSRCAACCIDD